eukprot:3678685-Alexandrium_andersonii.AAC.1
MASSSTASARRSCRTRTFAWATWPGCGLRFRPPDCKTPARRLGQRSPCAGLRLQRERVKPWRGRAPAW